ncbi:MAG: RNA-binding cell elongation regulator Jag/EloR [Bacilli bacterium]|nr:RNA-binding cell elongation regulator Jag/EloR [Bacilli bacterium]
MEKHSYTGKTKEEAIINAKEDLQEVETNLIIREVGTQKGGLFKSSKVEIEVIEKREVVRYIKEYIIQLLKELGFSAQVELKNKDEVPTYMIYSDNDALLIGKNGKNLKALSFYVGLHINKMIGRNFRFIIDINEYNKKREKRIESLAKRVAKEVAQTKIEAKLDAMNSYERRIVHNVLTNNKRVYTESEGEEPNRCVVIKPKEDE